MGAIMNKKALKCIKVLIAHTFYNLFQIYLPIWNP